MAKSILEEALEDANLLRETAIKNAQNVLVEAISPQIREFIDSQMGESDLAEMSPEAAHPEMAKILQVLADAGIDLSALMGGGGHEPEMGMGSGMDTGMDLGMGSHDEDPMMSYGDEEEEEDDVPEEGMYEACDDQETDKDEEDTMDEVVKIDEQDLAKAWAEVVKEEALEEAAQVPSPTVSGEFADAQNPNSNAKGGLGDSGTPGERGLEDKEHEEMWKDEVPPAAQDWTVKEGVFKRQFAAMVSKNKKLQQENTHLNLGVQKLQRSLTEVNLFNSKLLHTNKLLQSMNLTSEQRLTVIEAIDRALNLHEVELVYQSLSESFKIAGVSLSESKQTNKKARSSRYAQSAGGKMLKEQRERPSGEELVTERWARLAGVLGE